MGFPINPDGTIDYANPAPIPTRLTDGAVGYGEPSEAAMEAAKDVIVTIQESYGIEYKAGEPIDGVEWRLWATAFDAFAAQQAAAAVKERNAEIVATLEHQAEVWERMKDMTPSAELRANVYRSAANIIEQ